MVRCQYDAFGNLATSTGTWQGQFGYGGGFGYQQDATGLKLLGHPCYDSSTCRFLTRDRIKDGRNWYVYCDSDPVGQTDPPGMFLLNLIVVALSTGMRAWFYEEDWWRGVGRGFILGAMAALIEAITGSATTVGADYLVLTRCGEGAGAGAIVSFGIGVATKGVSVGSVS